jgi:hypothetical protein
MHCDIDLCHMRQAARHSYNLIHRKRAQSQSAAARADGGQQPARLVGNKQEQAALRRLFQRLEQGIGAVGVQFVAGIDYADAEPAIGRGFE